MNEKLEKLNLGLEEWLREPVESTDPRTIDTNGNPCEPYREITLLGYCCVEHKWQLAIKEALMTEKATPQVTWSGITDSYDTKPLLKATRPVRTKAMDLIPRLLDSIKISVREILAVHRQSRKGSGEAVARLLRRTQRCSSGAYPGGLLSTVSDSR